MGEKETKTEYKGEKMKQRKAPHPLVHDGTSTQEMLESSDSDGLNGILSVRRVTGNVKERSSNLWSFRFRLSPSRIFDSYSGDYSD